MEKYIDLHEEKNGNHKMDCKLSWIESALDMVEREDIDAPTLAGLMCLIINWMLSM